MKTSYLGGGFGAEGPGEIQPIMGSLNSRMLSIRRDIAGRLYASSAEHQEAEAAVKLTVPDLEAQIHTLKQQKSYATSVLTMVANTTKVHCSCMGREIASTPLESGPRRRHLGRSHLQLNFVGLLKI